MKLNPELYENDSGGLAGDPAAKATELAQFALMGDRFGAMPRAKRK